MAERGDVTINPVLRLITVAAPSTEITIQDLHDTIRAAEDELDLLQWPFFIDSDGKQVLNEETQVGVTSTLQNARIAFEARGTPVEMGTVTTADPNGSVLKDSAGQFEINGVQPGATVVNYTDFSVGTVYRVNSDIELELVNQLAGGTDNKFDLTDDYRIYNIVGCRVFGGNLVAVDDIGDTMSPLFPTAFTQVIIAQSASPTLSGVGGIPTVAEIADGVLEESVADHKGVSGSLAEAIASSRFEDGAVWVDKDNGSSGTTWPKGTRSDPVDNMADCRTILIAENLSRVHLRGTESLDATYANITFIGHGLSWSTIYINGQSVGGCRFEEMHVYGTLSGLSKTIHCVDCSIGTLSDFGGYLINCIFMSNNVSPFSSINMFNCKSKVDGGPGGYFPVTINLNGNSSVFMQDTTGHFILKGHDSQYAKSSINFLGGILEIDSTCVDGQITVGGNCILTDNSSAGCDVIDNTVNTQITSTQFGDGVFVSDDRGVTGTTGDIGSRINPVSGTGLTDATTIATAKKVRKFIFLDDSMYTLNQAYDDWVFDGETIAIINLNGQSLAGTMFYRCVVIGQGNPAGAFECVFSSVVVHTIAFRCVIGATVTIAGGDYYQCDYDQATVSVSASFNIRGGSGTLTLKDMSSGTVRVDDFRGNLVIDSSCVGGNIYINGNCSVSDNSGEFCNVSVTNIPKAVWAQSLPGDFGTGEAGKIVSDMSTNVELIKKVETGRWKIDTTTNTMIFYDENGTDPLLTFDLKDDGGLPSSEDIFERDPV